MWTRFIAWIVGSELPARHRAQQERLELSARAAQAEQRRNLSPVPNFARDDLTTGRGGMLYGMTFVQRVNTMSGKAPSTGGTVTGQEITVPHSRNFSSTGSVEGTDARRIRALRGRGQRPVNAPW